MASVRVDTIVRSIGRVTARLSRLHAAIVEHHLPLIAAGLSFYGLVAVFPALVLFLSIYGLAADPRVVEHHLAAAQGFLPDEVIRLLGHEMSKLIAHPVRRLTVSLGFGLVLTVATVTGCGRAVIHALNIVFGARETRGFVRRQMIALGLMAGVTSFVATMLGFLALTPAVLRHLGGSAALVALLAIVRWPLAAVMVGAALAAIYRHGPNHGRRVGWMLGWGTPAATVAWLAATAGFSLYVARFHTFDRTYGSIGAVVVLLVWLYLTALVMLLGGELHAQRLADTARDD
jgi:membrane protein